MHGYTPLYLVPSCLVKMCVFGYVLPFEYYYFRSKNYVSKSVLFDLNYIITVVCGICCAICTRFKLISIRFYPFLVTYQNCTCSQWTSIEISVYSNFTENRYDAIENAGII